MAAAVRTPTRACFFFQAEDGIRDRNVTGVQTCALPIFSINKFYARELRIISKHSLYYFRWNIIYIILISKAKCYSYIYFIFLSIFLSFLFLIILNNLIFRCVCQDYIKSSRLIFLLLINNYLF